MLRDIGLGNVPARGFGPASWADECTVREVTDIMAVDGAEVGTSRHPALAVPTSPACLVVPAPNDLAAAFPAGARIGPAARGGKPHPAIETIEIARVDRGVLIAEAPKRSRIRGTASGRRRRATCATLRETDQAAPRRAATARWLRGGCTPAPSERARRRIGEGASPSPPMMDAWNIRRPRVLPRPPAEGRAGRRRRAAREQRPRRSPACRRRAPSTRN